MNWTDFPWGAALTLAGLIAAVVTLAMDERNRRKFQTREDATGMSQRIDTDIAKLEAKTQRNTGLFVQLDDRTGDLEEKVARIEERQTQQWERISEQMANTARTIENVTKELKAITDQQHRFAVEMAQRGRTQE